MLCDNSQKTDKINKEYNIISDRYNDKRKLT